MTAYFDTSALAKLLRPEPGGDIARAAIVDADLRATSAISYPELCATVAGWDPRPGAPGMRAAGRELELFWPSLFVLDVDEATAHHAGELALRHHLRGMDAIHVASALEIAGESRGTLSFVSWDNDQRAAAGKEGLTVVPEKR